METATPLEPPRRTIAGRIVQVARRDLPLAFLDAVVVVPAYLLPARAPL